MKSRLSSGFMSMFSHSGGSTPTASPEKGGRHDEERKAQGSGLEGLPRVCLLEAFGEGGGGCEEGGRRGTRTRTRTRTSEEEEEVVVVMVCLREVVSSKESLTILQDRSKTSRSTR